MRLEILEGYAPILDRHVFRQKLLAVALRQMRSSREVGRQEAKRLGVPMQSAAADAVAEHESTPVAHRQGRLTGVVPERHRHLRRLQEKLVLQAVAQLVLRVGDGKIGGRVAPGTTLERNNVEPGLRQFVCENGAGPAEPNDDGVFSRKPVGHCSDLTAINSNQTGMAIWRYYCDQFG